MSETGTLLEDVKKEAEALAGRPLEVEQTADGKWIVMWMAFDKAPPPKGDSELEALQGFVAMMKSMAEVPPPE